MASDLLKSLSDLKGRWVVGGSAVEKAPASWQDVVRDDPNPDLALLAISGQAMQFVMRAVPGEELIELPLLPRLGLPTPPLTARRQLQAMVRVTKYTESQMSQILHLLAMRGYVVHPTDYMPTSFESLPDSYASWASWHRVGDAQVDDGHESLSAENWDDWLPAERRVALALLRREHPEVARELITVRVPSLPAEERLKVIEILGEGLSEEDQSLLDGFVSDRSGKVRRVVAQFLARLGRVEDDESDVAEFADFFKASKRAFRGGYKIEASRLKTKAQRKRRAELAEALSLRGFMRGLQLASEAELIQGWHHVDEEASDVLVRMVAETGSEEAVAMLASRISTLEGISAESFQRLFHRLGRESRRELLPGVLGNDDGSLSASVTCAQGLWGEVPFEQLKSLGAIKKLKKLAGEDRRGETLRMETLRQGLFALGLLADQGAAEALIKLFTDQQMFASDPMLGLLKLNACLPAGEPL